MVRTEPNPTVLRWLSQVPDHHIHVSVLTLGHKGVERLAPGSRRERLRLWLEHDLPGWFGQRVLSIDLSVADRRGRLLGETGRSLPAIDSLPAATALHHELRLVTHNRQDFLFPGLDVIDPWEWP